MRAADLFRISSRQVLRQYRKNIGVIVTIILGSAGLIVMITMGRSVEQNISNDLEIIGNATRLTAVLKIDYSTPLQINTETFFQESIESVKAIPGVTDVGSIARRKNSTVNYQNTSSAFELIGVDNAFWTVHGASAASGTLFTETDLAAHRSVCVLGQRTAKELFAETNPIGKFITIDNSFFQVVGVLDGISMPDKVRHVFLPITTARDRLSGVTPIVKLYIRCNSWDDVNRVLAAIPKAIHRHQPGADVKVFYPKEILSRVKAISFGVKIFVQLALVATFILGGIGIWNIMMMAVRARTREIGLKKAIGAEDHDILFQFLTESLMLSISASTIGFFLGWGGVSFVATVLQNSPPKDLFWLSTAISFSFSLLLGIVAGLAPAIKASKMEVVTALRYE